MTKQKKEFVAALFLALIAAASLYAWTRSFVRGYQMISVPRAARELAAPQRLVASDISLVDMPQASVPPGVVTNIDKLVGSVVTRPLVAGSWFTSYDVVYGRDPGSDAALLLPGTVGLLLPATWFLGALPAVKMHDFIDIFAVPGRGGAGVLLLSHAPVERVASGKNDEPNAILVSVLPNDVRRVAEARASQMGLVMVVWSATSASSTPAP